MPEGSRAMEMVEAHLLEAPKEWNLQPLPCQNTYGFFFMMVAMENISPHKIALRFMAFVTLGVNCCTQLTLLWFIASKIMKAAPQDEEDEHKRVLLGMILGACLFCFFVAMLNNAKNGWVQSAMMTFSGGEEWGGEPPKGRRYATLTTHKKIAILTFSVLPEHVLWVMQLIVGIRFLASCTDYIDLVMNAVALIFVSDVDEMIYQAIVPTLIKNNWDVLLKVDAFHMMNPEKCIEGQIMGDNRFQDRIFRFELFALLPLTCGAATAASYFAEEIAPVFHGVRA